MKMRFLRDIIEEKRIAREARNAAGEDAAEPAVQGIPPMKETLAEFAPKADAQGSADELDFDLKNLEITQKYDDDQGWVGAETPESEEIKTDLDGLHDMFDDAGDEAAEQHDALNLEGFEVGEAAQDETTAEPEKVEAEPKGNSLSEALDAAAADLEALQLEAEPDGAEEPTDALEDKAEAVLEDVASEAPAEQEIAEPFAEMLEEVEPANDEATVEDVMAALQAEPETLEEAEASELAEPETDVTEAEATEADVAEAEAADVVDEIDLTDLALDDVAADEEAPEVEIEAEGSDDAEAEMVSEEAPEPVAEETAEEVEAANADEAEAFKEALQEAAPELDDVAAVLEADAPDAAPEPEEAQAAPAEAETASVAEPEAEMAAPVAVPLPAAGRGAGGRSGRVKTRILGFTSPATASEDPFEKAGGQAKPTAAMASFPVGWLVVVDGPGRGSAFTIFDGVTQIGRGEDQTVRLDFGDNSISRENHAAIAYDNEQKTFFIGHGGKANLVRVNNRPVLSTEELQSEDKVRIGETTLRFVAFCGANFSWDHDEDVKRATAQ